MIKETISVDEAISFLNELVRIDPTMLRSLILNRVPCSAAMAEHPTVQVSLGADGTFEIGLLGVLNGLFGADDKGWGAIAAVVNVVCPDCTQETGTSQIEGDLCASCGTPLVLGDVSGFHRTTATLASEPDETS